MKNSYKLFRKNPCPAVQGFLNQPIKKHLDTLGYQYCDAAAFTLKKREI